jgi:hypothetical protein
MQDFWTLMTPINVNHLQLCFKPILQHVVNEYIGVWNTHRVRGINENNHFREGHVPYGYFRV